MEIFVVEEVFWETLRVQCGDQLLTDQERKVGGGFESQIVMLIV